MTHKIKLQVKRCLSSNRTDYTPASGELLFETDTDTIYVGDGSTAGGILVTTSNTGETNTASNIGTSGVGVYKQKTGVDLEFKKINAGSSKITITDDTGNNEIDIDIDEANLSTVIKKAEFTEKGEILIGTGDGTYAPLEPIDDCRVLTLDSNETTGVKWGCPRGNVYPTYYKTANYTMDLFDDVNIVCAGSSAITITFPDATGFPQDNHAREYGILNLGASDVTISLSGTNTFNDGTSDRTIQTGYSLRIIGLYPSVGGGWAVTAQPRAGLQLRRSANWTASNFSSLTAIPFDVLDHKSDQYRIDANITTNSTRITAKKTGEYFVSCHGDINSTGGSSYSIAGYIRKNGTTKINGTDFSFGNYQTEDTFFALPAIIVELTTDDYIELMLDQNNLTGQAEDVVLLLVEA